MAGMVVHTSDSIQPQRHSDDSIEAIENDREFKAHVYQQLIDLQPFLSPESQIAVIVNHGRDDDDEISELSEGDEDDGDPAAVEKIGRGFIRELQGAG